MLQRYWIRNSPRASTIGWLDLADYIMRYDIFKVKRSKEQNMTSSDYNICRDVSCDLTLAPVK